MTIVDLAELKAGMTGTITNIDGGHGITNRLDAMGIRCGIKVTKLSGQFMRGPVIIKVGKTQIAIGYGMAKKVLVQVG
ncbi:MAG: ferrous iron transport protein A [candidate division WOR-3 bacterium]|nr:MAG: ferrous iron transport protein A [candidate division WOR-3 bacterium]